MSQNKVTPYRMGWLLVMFDLPTGTSDERRAAGKFRKFLLDDGYQMLQFSVYSRACVSYEHVEKHAARMRQSTPTDGFVRMMFLTDKQWGLSVNLIGKATDVGGRKPEQTMPPQIVFW
jgi:CRISPR-associated protein Cas2